MKYLVLALLLLSACGSGSVPQGTSPKPVDPSQPKEVCTQPATWTVRFTGPVGGSSFINAISISMDGDQVVSYAGFTVQPLGAPGSVVDFTFTGCKFTQGYITSSGADITFLKNGQQDVIMDHLSLGGSWAFQQQDLDYLNAF